MREGGGRRGGGRGIGVIGRRRGKKVHDILLDWEIVANNDLDHISRSALLWQTSYLALLVLLCSFISSLLSSPHVNQKETASTIPHPPSSP